MKKEQKDKKNKSKNQKIIIIVAAILVALIISGLIFSKIFIKKSTGTDWGDKYYELLIDSLDSTYDGNKDLQISKSKSDIETYFIQSDKYEAPVMVNEFVYNDNTTDYNYFNISIIKDEQVKKYSTGYSITKNKNDKTELKYLYDIENKTYGWYTYQYTAETKIHQFFPLSALIKQADESKNVKDITEIANKYDKERLSYTDEQMKEDEYGLSEFNQKYIDLTNKLSIHKIKFTKSIKKKLLKNLITKSVTKYKEKKNNNDKKVRLNIEKFITDIQEKQDQKKKAEEEAKRKAEEEAKKAAEEEAKRKAEEAAKGLTLNNHTIKYGTYVGETNGPTDGMNITINADKTFKLKEYDGSIVTGYFKIETVDFAQDITPHYVQAMQLYKSDGQKYGAYTAWSNTVIGDNDMMSFTYSGN